MKQYLKETKHKKIPIKPTCWAKKTNNLKEPKWQKTLSIENIHWKPEKLLGEEVQSPRNNWGKNNVSKKPDEIKLQKTNHAEENR